MTPPKTIYYTDDARISSRKFNLVKVIKENMYLYEAAVGHWRTTFSNFDLGIRNGTQQEENLRTNQAKYIKHCRRQFKSPKIDFKPQ